MDFSRDLICDNLSVDGERLLFAGQDTTKLAEQYGTPLYLMDEDRIRNRARTYRDALQECFGDKGHALFASKACSFKRMYAIMAEEGLGVDVVSGGELTTAHKAGFPMERVYFHSNNKTDWEIGYCCLFTLGLKGKEVGEFIQKKRHYIISSEIRKKLGLGEHDTNIGIWLRALLSETESL